MMWLLANVPAIVDPVIGAAREPWISGGKVDFRIHEEVEPEFDEDDSDF